MPGATFSLRYRPELVEQIDRAATADGINRSEWIRRACVEALRVDELGRAETPVHIEPIDFEAPVTDPMAPAGRRSSRRGGADRKAASAVAGSGYSASGPLGNTPPACSHEKVKTTSYGARICEKCETVLPKASRR